MLSAGRRIATIAAALLVMSSIAVAPPATAHAVIPDVTCVAGTETQTFDPGLRTFAQPTHFTAAARIGSESGLLPCVSTDPGLTGGQYDVDVTQSVSCLTLLGGGPAQLTIHWNNGQHSVLTGNSAVQVVGGQSVTTVAGTVTSGQFLGKKWRLVLTAPSLDIALCLTPPGIISRNALIVEFIVSTVLVWNGSRMSFSLSRHPHNGCRGRGVGLSAPPRGLQVEAFGRGLPGRFTLFLANGHNVALLPDPGRPYDLVMPAVCSRNPR